MSRKRPASAIVEPNNNDSDLQPMGKKRRTMNERLMAQLQSDFTEKMITPIKSPNGQPTSRSGRKIHKNESQNSPQRQRKSTTAALNADQCLSQKTSRSKRKVRKVFSIHSMGANNALLRLVSNRQSTVLIKSPIQKLISVSKIGLNNNNQFQTQLTESSINTAREINDMGADVSVSAPSSVALLTDCSTESNNSSSTDFGQMDFEINLKPFIIQNSTLPAQIIDEIDLTSSPEGSEHGDDTKSNCSGTQSKSFSVSDTYSMTHRSNASQDNTDSPKKIGTPGEMNSASIGSDTNLFNDDKSFSEGKSDDCVITSYVDEAHNSDVCSTDDWCVGQIVWAALFGYPFWPAIIFNEKESQTFRKGKFTE